LGKIRIYRRVPPGEVLDLLDRRALFVSRWGYGSIDQRQRLVLESKLTAMWGELSSPEHWSAGTVWAPFNARLDGDNLTLEGAVPKTQFCLKPDKLPVAILLGLKNRKKVVLQAVTLGRAATRLSKSKKGAEDRLYWHGLAAEAAEALAEWCSRRANGEMGWKGCRRISPGFPAWPELSEQRKIFRALRPGRIGVRLSRSCQMMPEYSTSAAVFTI
jgi:5-methyltetrahydrofolate--homocysteine methyltransferase